MTVREHGFLHGGERSAALALREEYAVTISKLEGRRDAADGREERERLRVGIEAARSELAEKLRGLSGGLFGRS